MQKKKCFSLLSMKVKYRFTMRKVALYRGKSGTLLWEKWHFITSKAVLCQPNSARRASSTLRTG